VCVCVRVCVCVWSVDVDECREMTGVCANGDCINLLGSFNCICHAGYTLTADRTTCVGTTLCLSVCLSVSLSVRVCLPGLSVVSLVLYCRKFQLKVSMK